MEYKIVLFVMQLIANTYQQCPGYRIVQNGLANFQIGITNIGGFTDAVTYLQAGLEYIAKTCQ